MIDLFEGLYVIYILNFFKTNTNFQNSVNLLLQSSLGSGFMQHSLTADYGKKICSLGSLVGWIYGLYLICRRHFLDSKTMRICSFIWIILLTWGGLTMNLNFFVYLVPIIIIEIFNFLD